MYLVYFDESGNTGKNLADVQQKIFVLCSLMVPVNRWQEIERDLLRVLRTFFPDADEDLEIHAHDLVSPGRKSYFRQFSQEKRLAFRDEWLQIAVNYQLTIIYHAIIKRRFQQYILTTMGSGVSINPHVVAFPIIARIVDDYLASLPEKPLAMFISDENQDVARDLEKSLRALRFEESSLKLSQVVEKGFFIDSKKSLVLQLCDLCTLVIRKMEERKGGLPIPPSFTAAIQRIEPLIHIGSPSVPDTIDWIKASQEKKKERPGT